MLFSLLTFSVLFSKLGQIQPSATIASNVALVLRPLTFAAIRRHSAAYRLYSPEPISVRPAEPHVRHRAAVSTAALPLGAYSVTPSPAATAS